MKVILINGSPHTGGCTYTALSEVARGLTDYGVDTEIIHIGNHDIPGRAGKVYPAYHSLQRYGAGMMRLRGFSG